MMQISIQPHSAFQMNMYTLPNNGGVRFHNEQCQCGETGQYEALCASSNPDDNFIFDHKPEDDA